MFWAFVSTVFIVYLYRQLNAGNRAEPKDIQPDNSVESELAALNEQIAVLEARLGSTTMENPER